MEWELTIDKNLCYTPEICSICVCEKGINGIHVRLEKDKPLLFNANNYNEELEKLLKMVDKCPTNALRVETYVKKIT